MSTSDFPPNSEASKKIRPEGKNISPVVKSGAVRRKNSLRKQFSKAFIGGDFKSAVSYALIDVMLPSAREMIIDSFIGGIEKLFRGDTRRRGSLSPQSGPTGFVSYNRYAQGGNRLGGLQRTMSRRARARHDFDEIILDTRGEAEDVLERLHEVVSQYECATVADLYELVSLPSTHADNKWGWTDLTGSDVTRIRGGYLLDLPEPEPID
jgi:hypothetical protein